MTQQGPGILLRSMINQDSNELLGKRLKSARNEGAEIKRVAWVLGVPACSLDSSRDPACQVLLGPAGLLVNY